jgi:anti-sigma B factor antagonist
MFAPMAVGEVPRVGLKALFGGWRNGWRSLNVAYVAANPLPPFEVSCMHDGSAAHLALRGELDMLSAPLLARALESASRGDPARVILDLRELRFMDVSGLRAILDAARSARRDGRSLVIANPMPHIVRLLELTAIDQSLEVLGRPLASVS